MKRLNQKIIVEYGNIAESIDNQETEGELIKSGKGDPSVHTEGIRKRTVPILNPFRGADDTGRNETLREQKILQLSELRRIIPEELTIGNFVANGAMLVMIANLGLAFQLTRAKVLR